MIYNYIQGFRLINAIVRSLPAANIETLLTDEVRASAFTKACGFYSQQARFLETPLALQNMALSAKAYALLPEGVRLGILNDQTAIQNLTATILGEDQATFGFDDISQFVGDQAVMSVVFSSEPASQVIAASATAMNAIVNSGAALSVLWQPGGQPGVEALKGVLTAQKAFVDGPYYAEAFKPAVLAGILLDGQLFAASGTFTVPAYVTSVHVVCVGKGGDGQGKQEESSSPNGTGGGGGALCWKNAIDVAGYKEIAITIDTDSSKFLSVTAGAGRNSNRGTFSGGDGGGNGGTGYGYNSGTGSGGAGGAGGYSGDGGRGQYHSFSDENNKAAPGSGGGGGGGASITNGVSGLATAGGGVGIYGQGPDGAAGIYGGDTRGKAGSAGTNGNINGGAYGGGGSGRGGIGGPGVVRIIWGASRAFPSTNVEKIV